MNDPNGLFEGFTAEMWQEVVRLPAAFFTQLLPQIHTLAELKVLLFCFWALPQKAGDFPYLRRCDFAQHLPLMRGLAEAAPDQSTDEGLDAALAAMVQRGALLCAVVPMNDTSEPLYFMNTPRGQAAIAQIAAGEFRPLTSELIEILPERPTIYALYERNIGPLTPMIAEELKDLEREFPVEWIAEAFREAVTANARKLKYIRAVLVRWQQEGRAVAKSTDSFESDGRRYVTGKYADFIQH